MVVRNRKALRASTTTLGDDISIPSKCSVGSVEQEELAAFNWPSVQAAIMIAVYGSYCFGPYCLWWSSKQAWVVALSMSSGGDGWSALSDGAPRSLAFRVLAAWAIAEALFLLYFLQRLVYFQRTPTWQPLPTKKERLKLWQGQLDAMPHGPMPWLVEWFSGTPVEELTTGDLDMFLYFLMNFANDKAAHPARHGSAQNPSTVRIDDAEDPVRDGQHWWREVDVMVAMMARKDPAVLDLRPGPAKHASKLMAYMRDPCVAWPPALFLYAIVSLLHLGFSASYLARGYRRYTAQDLVYWHKPGRGGKAAAPLPMVFFPGVGAGCLMYDMLLGLVEAQDPHRDIFVVQIPSVSMSASNWLPGHADPPSPRGVGESLELMLRERGECERRCERGAVLVAHSYGSTYASYLLRHCPRLVKGMVLAEPAVIMTHLNKMTTSFMYSFGPDGLKSPLSVLFRLEVSTRCAAPGSQPATCRFSISFLLAAPPFHTLPMCVPPRALLP